jgi:hypothetical protein
MLEKLNNKVHNRYHIKAADVMHSYKNENMRTAVTATSLVCESSECFQENPTTIIVPKYEQI